MFVYYFVHIDRPFEETRRIVLGLLDGLADAADIAYREGEELRMRAGVGRKLVAKTVRLDVATPFQHNGEVAIPLTWEATGPTGLFPTMEAELILATLGPRFTQISFRGSYRPQWEVLGRRSTRGCFTESPRPRLSTSSIASEPRSSAGQEKQRRPQGEASRFLALCESTL